MIKYLGSKRTLLPLLSSVAAALPAVRTALDLFSGTARVARAFKGLGLQVTANDHNLYAAVLARALIEADLETHGWAATVALAHLQALPPRPGYVTRTFCHDARFFTPENGAHIDAIRAGLDELHLCEPLRSVCLAALLEAADRVDSTVGVQMAYLKGWSPRAVQPLTLRLPALLPRARHGGGAGWCREAVDAARAWRGDLAYLDPPYNQHSYLSNYHVWETLARNDEPVAYGMAMKRADCRTRRSAFNSKPGCHAALAEVLAALDCRYLMVSFNDEGFITRAEMEDLLRQRGTVVTIVRPYLRYIGARIGIYNGDGDKVGRVSHTTNHELVYVVLPAGQEVPAALAAMACATLD